MGQTLSVDFRSAVARMQKRTIAPADHDHWKVFFLTSMSPDDIATYLAPRDVRMLRRAMPHNLAQLVHKCMQQMAAFVEDAEDAFTGEPAERKRRRVVDDCAVLNAIRIIGSIVPYVLEAKVCEPFSEPKNPMFPHPPLPQSPHAEHFAEALFWRNDACRPDGDSAAGATAVLPPVLRTSRTAGRNVPLGEELMVLLTRLCFVPSWTIDKSIGMVRHPIRFEGEATEGDGLSQHRVVADYLLCPGLLKETVADGALFFAKDVKLRRYEVVRCIIACLTTPVGVGRSLAPNPFLDCLVDANRNDLAPTLCCSLVNYVAQYMARGVAPFSSHFWAELPEAFLAESMQLLSLCLTFDANPEVEPTMSAASGPVVDERNAFRHFLLQLASDAKLSSYVAAGVFRVIENPLYAATTVLKGSQRRLNCVSEGLQLAMRLALLPAPGFLTAFGSMADALLFPLLFFLQIVKSGRRFVADAQIALDLVLKLTTLPDAAATLQSKFPGVMPFSDLPAVGPDATYGDVLVLALCDLLSPGTPRWVLPLCNTAAVILCNAAPHVALQEKQAFELFHVLDHVTSPAFHHAMPRAVDRDLVVTRVVNAVATMCVTRPHASLPLVAALATVDMPGRLRAICDVDAPAPKDFDTALAMGGDQAAATEMTEDRTSRARLQLSPAAAELLLEPVIMRLSEIAHRVVGNLPADAEPSAALEPCIAREWPALPATPVAEDLSVTVERRQYLTTSLWATIFEHNARPPLFDSTESALFKAAPKLTPEALAALAEEDAARLAAAEEAARKAQEAKAIAA